MPRADELPASLAKLVRRQALELSPNRFDLDIRRLLRVLDRTITEAQEQTRQQAEEAAARHQEQVEQLQGQIRARTTAQDSHGVVAASEGPAALDRAAVDPDGLASNARERLGRSQQAEEPTAQDPEQFTQPSSEHQAVRTRPAQVARRRKQGWYSVGWAVGCAPCALKISNW